MSKRQTSLIVQSVQLLVVYSVIRFHIIGTARAVDLSCRNGAADEKGANMSTHEVIARRVMDMLLSGMDEDEIVALEAVTLDCLDAALAAGAAAPYADGDVIIDCDYIEETMGRRLTRREWGVVRDMWNRRLDELDVPVVAHGKGARA